MDELERRLKEYDEYNRAQISEEFLQRLKTLEAAPAAPQRPRGRYVLPVAAAIALVICLGSVWAWLHFSQPVDHRTPPAVTLEEPPIPEADTPPIPSEPATPETNTRTELIYTSKPPAEESPIAQPFSPEKPGQAGTAQPRSDTPAAPLPEEPAPAAPEDTTPVKPDDPNPAATDAPAPSEETNPPPDDPNPPKPDDPDPPEPEEPDPPDPPEADPPDDPPAVVKLESPFTAEFHSEGDRDIVTLILLSTGERVEVDVTGWVASSGQAASAGEHPDDPQTPQNGITGSWVAVAFHQPVYIQFTVDGDGTVHADAYYLTDYINHITQSIPGKENEDET